MEPARVTALLDTGFLLAVIDADDDLHETCVIALQEEPEPLLPEVVLPELAYLLLREMGYPALIKFLKALANGELPLISTTREDLERTTEVLEKYTDNRVDFVDCVIVAMAERLNISRVLTVDQRHFRIFRPVHFGYSGALEVKDGNTAVVECSEADGSRCGPSRQTGYRVRHATDYRRYTE